MESNNTKFLRNFFPASNNEEDIKISNNEMVEEFYNLNERFDLILNKIENMALKIQTIEENKKITDSHITNISTIIGNLNSKSPNSIKNEIDKKLLLVEQLLNNLQNKTEQLEQSKVIKDSRLINFQNWMENLLNTGYNKQAVIQKAQEAGWSDSIIQESLRAINHE